MNLKNLVNEIGSSMITCQQYCDGVLLDADNGILPRFLILETEVRKDWQDCPGSVIIGINPGRSSSSERQFYVTNGQTYEKVVEYWHKKIRERKYYKGLRALIDGLGYRGPILWTELAMCEKAPGVSGLLPLQTFRTCTGTYLRRELEAIPDTWLLVAVGKHTFVATAYLHPDRAVLGVPHPTGSYGHFLKLFKTNGVLQPSVRRQAEGVWKCGIGQAVWLTA